MEHHNRNRSKRCDRTCHSAAERLEFEYRERFRNLILATEPEQVLDVGCGDGKMLTWMHERGVCIEGVDPQAKGIAELRDRGLVVHEASAEQLPIPDGAFDIVASEFCAHHFSDVGKALREMLRVARRAIFLLDGWYDLSIESQRISRRWDSWCKRIDRRNGMVHNDVVPTGEFVRALADCTERVEFQHWLQLVPVDLDWLGRESAENLRLATIEESAELAEIRALALSQGMTHDGVIVVQAVRQV